jgi:hypothetical protein
MWVKRGDYKNMMDDEMKTRNGLMDEYAEWLRWTLRDLRAAGIMKKPVTKPRKCGSCRQPGHTKANCPKKIQIWLDDVELDADELALLDKMPRKQKHH